MGSSQLALPDETMMAHEPNADLLTAEDVDGDVAALSEALLEKRVERIAHNVLLRHTLRSDRHDSLAHLEEEFADYDQQFPRD